MKEHRQLRLLWWRPTHSGVADAADSTIVIRHSNSSGPFLLTAVRIRSGLAVSLETWAVTS